MDEEGFREYFRKLKRSPRGADIYIKMIKKYENFLRKYRDHDKIDSSSIKDLKAFGKWLKEENFQQTIINMYKLALGHYFTHTEKNKLARIVENDFEK